MIGFEVWWLTSPPLPWRRWREVSGRVESICLELTLLFCILLGRNIHKTIKSAILWKSRLFNWILLGIGYITNVWIWSLFNKWAKIFYFLIDGSLYWIADWNDFHLKDEKWARLAAIFYFYFFDCIYWYRFVEIYRSDLPRKNLSAVKILFNKKQKNLLFQNTNF